MKKGLGQRVLALMAVGVMMLAGGCSSGGGETDGPVSIGVIQYMEHAALDDSYRGFVDALAEQGYKDGENISIDFQNAQGDGNNLSTIGDRLVGDNVDLILAITTDAAQAVAGKTAEIPILATAVTSYTTAGLVDSDAVPGGNVTGTSDMNPVAAQIDLLAELVPEAKTIGLLYTSSEDNSVLQIEMAKTHIENIGLQWAEVTVTGVGDVQQATASLVARCDAIYIPTDNTIASAMATVHSVTRESKTATVCGESNMVLQGGLATMGINYYDLGYQTGLMAVDVINGTDPATMPIQYAASSDAVTINGLVASEIGFAVPEKYADVVVDGSGQ